eukprot:1193608-Prorocentrum_minimum.AAC.1
MNVKYVLLTAFCLQSGIRHVELGWACGASAVDRPTLPNHTTLSRQTHRVVQERWIDCWTVVLMILAYQMPAQILAHSCAHDEP